jgi:hypothetical protein
MQSSSTERPRPPAAVRRRSSNGYSRRASNELAASVRLDELRQLQSQLGMLIQNAREETMIDEECGGSYTGSEEDMMESRRSSSSSYVVHRGSMATAATSCGNSWDPRRVSEATTEGEHSALLGSNTSGSGSSDRVDAFDIESGMPSSMMYKPRRVLSQQTDFDPPPAINESEGTLPLVHRTTHRQSSESTLIVTHRTGASLEAVGASPPLAASDTTHSDIGSDVTDPTITTTGSESKQDALSASKSRSGRWSRSRSPSRRGLLSRARSSSRGRTSIFKKKGSPLDNSDRSTLGASGRSKRGLLPNYDFLQKENEEKEEASLRGGSKWWHGVFLFSIISMLACIITLWAPYPIGARMPSDQIAMMPWSNGCQGVDMCICPRETICADDLLSMIFLTIARSSAWFDYPLYMLLFMSKANNLNNFLQKTALRCWINFSDYHKVHSLFGIIVGIESASHTFFHLLRWARRNNDIQLLWTTRTGITGLIAIMITPFIVLPMTVPYLKNRMKFEWRKALHYLSVVWGVALMCHAPQRIFWLIGIPVFIYTADKMVEGLFKTHLVESAHFQRLGDTSCIISFENPPGFGKQNSAYVYLMLPWLSKYQFHAFTVFPGTKKNHSSICIHKGGDWTGKLMKAITTPTHKPAFVVGPFLSPFSSPAMDSENLVAVASGIGVTPAISLIKQYSSTSRRLNLVWICRDAGLVEHFLQNVEFGSDGYTLIYYTGKRSLILRDDLPPNVFMFNGRPNLERTISGIISSIATGEGLPEELSKKVLTRTPAEMRSKLLLEKALSIYKIDQLFDYTVKASNHYNEGLEPLVETVNYQGVLSTMRHLLGSDDCELVTDQITQNFEKVDTDGYCRLDRDEFEAFLNLMQRGSCASDAEDCMSNSMQNVKRGLERMNTCRDMFESGRKTSDSGSQFGKDEFGIKRHLLGDGKFAAKNWNMLYCGGSQPVLDQLKAYKRKFGIGLSVEKFDW